jgi:cytoskeletal protein CcmA (bactofilin family)
MFNSKANKAERNKSKTMERNVIAKNSTFIGDITSDGDFRIDGVLEGTLKTNGRVIIGAEGVIKGAVESENADIEGRFSGQLSVANTLTIKSMANISGDVIAGKLSIEPGAVFNGTCVMKGAIKEMKNGNETKKYSEKTAS